MPDKMTIKKVQAQMRRTGNNIRTLLRRELRLGKPLSYADNFDAKPPNTDIRRVPTPFSGGN